MILEKTTGTIKLHNKRARCAVFPKDIMDKMGIPIESTIDYVYLDDGKTQTLTLTKPKEDKE